MSLEQQVRELNDLVAAGQLVEGIDRYYADDVEMAESAAQSMRGKEANRARELAFQTGLTRWDAQLLSSAVDDAKGTALNQWAIDYSHAEWGDGTLRQVAVQQWRDGRVVRESFYKM
ncbi:MAG TPA: nuclear transport factor 2 family protein [Thermoanaerobaculia bacterium]|nr:nuclear transport factor 2 family protein [Thermoanaerobaculia bacterium]